MTLCILLVCCIYGRHIFILALVIFFFFCQWCRRTIQVEVVHMNVLADDPTVRRACYFFSAPCSQVGPCYTRSVGRLRRVLKGRGDWPCIYAYARYYRFLKRPRVTRRISLSFCWCIYTPLKKYYLAYHLHSTSKLYIPSRILLLLSWKK